MDLLKLALDPRKANRRFSPFTNALPPGMERRLKYAFGDRASADPNDLAVYSRDAASPPAALDLALKRRAWAVVRPATTGDLLEVIRFARDNFIPIVPRGSGTSGTGGALPTEGGVVVDMRSFDRIVAVDKAAKTATVEAGVRFWDLETRLRAEGLALRQYPTSARGATIGGWLATGGGGVGSHRYGPFA
ncbi:MAG TPA: FAD-dependent oxidoreductase, partial [Candidatus Thermoplasmatota archaeon]|nr:FAD-dependent oxidoreductase [Candidatus Thermoplasmatota archaeon]